MNIKIKIALLFLTIAASQLFADNKDALIKNLEESLMAPCCWAGTVADQDNKEMKTQIHKLVAEGKSRQEILDHFVEIYGERILANPKAEGFNLMAWIAPVFIFLLAIAILVYYIKRSGTEMVNIEEVSDSDKVEFNDQIEKELKEME